MRSRFGSFVCILTSLVAFLAAELAAPTAADAQPTARSFEALRMQEKPGQVVRLFDVNGRQTIGRIVDVSATEIVLDVKDADGKFQKRTFAETDVRQIRRKKSHWAGPVTGLVTGIVIAAQLCRVDGECGNGHRVTRRNPDDDEGVSPMHVSGPLMLASLAGGPALGRLFDRPGLERILYRAP
jgi:hypothetical protein